MLAHCRHFSSTLFCMPLSEDLAKFMASITTERGWWHGIYLKADNNPVSSDVVFPITSKLFLLPDEAIKAIFSLVGTLDKVSNKSNEHALKWIGLDMIKSKHVLLNKKRN